MNALCDQKVVAQGPKEYNSSQVIRNALVKRHISIT
jgi:hypothetical protein